MGEERPLIGNRLLLGLVVVVLLLVGVRALLDIRSSLVAGPTATTRDAAPLDAPVEPWTGQRMTSVPTVAAPAVVEHDGSINLVDAERLAPTLLQDADELAAYLAAFPVRDYEVVEVKGVGKFYLDEGADYIKDRLRAGSVWEPRIILMMEKLARPGSTLIDVGAHIGTHTLSMSRIAGPKGRVYAFEPQKKIYRELTENLKLNGIDNVTALRYAVGDGPGIVEMDPATEGNEGATAVGSGGDAVEVRTIDSFGFRNVSLIKVDVEGFERPVLEGAERTLAESRPVLIVEIQGGHSFDYATSEIRRKIFETIEYIEGLSYRVVRGTMDSYVGLPLPPEVSTQP